MPRGASVGSRLDAYRDVGGRATQEAKAERRPSGCLGAIADKLAKYLHEITTAKYSVVISKVLIDRVSFI